MSISASMVKELRERTGAGMMDCKKALVESDGNMDTAIEFLQKKQLASASKRAGKIAAEGLVGNYIHMGGRIGVLLEVNCETDFVARSDDFQGFVKDVAMHIAGTPTVPLVVSSEELDASEVARQKDIFLGQAAEEGKPEHIAAKIVEGRMSKWFAEVCLLEQKYVKNDDKTIEQVVQDTVSTIGENIKVRRFSRFVLGEGLEKRSDDFAAEVAAAQAGV